MRRYCAGAGLSKSRFDCWRRELRDREDGRLGSSPPASAPIRLAEAIVDRTAASTPRESWSGVELARASGWAVRLAVGFDEGTLRRVLAALEAGVFGC